MSAERKPIKTVILGAEKTGKSALVKKVSHFPIFLLQVGLWHGCMTSNTFSSTYIQYLLTNITRRLKAPIRITSQ